MVQWVCGDGLLHRIILLAARSPMLHFSSTLLESVACISVGIPKIPIFVRNLFICYVH